MDKITREERAEWYVLVENIEYLRQQVRHPAELWKRPDIAVTDKALDDVIEKYAAMKERMASGV